MAGEEAVGLAGAVLHGEGAGEAEGVEAVEVATGGEDFGGAEEVAAGWDAIMSATGYIEFEIADASVTIVDPVAWVTCVERITSAVGEGGQTAVAEVAATNLFVLDGTGWHLALHHASPVIRPALVDE